MLLFLQPKPIDFYCFKDQATLKMYTGRDQMFYLGDKFYYGYGPPYGESIAEYVLSQLSEGGTSLAFLHEGVTMLLDYSSRNYHHATNNFLTDGTLDPVRVLADDQSYSALIGAKKRVEAASLCAYIMYDYGNDKFMMLYHSKDKFEDAVKKSLGVDIDKLQKDWEAFLPEHTIEKEEARERESGGTP